VDWAALRGHRPQQSPVTTTGSSSHIDCDPARRFLALAALLRFLSCTAERIWRFWEWELSFDAFGEHGRMAETNKSARTCQGDCIMLHFGVAAERRRTADTPGETPPTVTLWAMVYLLLYKNHPITAMAHLAPGS
jgi:hypothetical protein